MALNSEEFRRRREAREAQRKAWAARQKKLTLRLLIAAGVLLAVGVLIFALSRAGSSGPEDTVPTVEAQPTDTQPPDLTEKTVIHFVAGGDLNVTDKVVAAGGENYDYEKTFLDILPVLAGADLTTVNLEGNVCGAPYGTATASAPQSLLQALADAGVDMIQMANSRSIHNGLAGLSETLTNIRAAGMEPLGAYANHDDFNAYEGYSVFEVNGVKVGVVAITKGMDGLGLPAGSEFCVNVMYKDYATTYQKVNTGRLQELMKDVKLEQPDVIIALLHWGSEYNDAVSKSQTAVRKLLLDEGVDVIVGTHPHYVQAIETDEATGGIVAYSLGDFLGDGVRAGTAYSILLDLEITKDHATGTSAVTKVDYIPIYTVKDEDGGMRILRLREAVAAYENGEIGCVTKAQYTEMVDALAKIEARVTPEPPKT